MRNNDSKVISLFLIVVVPMIFLITACAGPTVERSRFRIASMAGEPPVPLPIDRSEFAGTDIEAIKSAEVSTRGNRILRDKALVDISISEAVKSHGPPDAVELNFTSAGQVHWFSFFYRIPPKTLVFRRSLADVKWLSIRELEKSHLIAELDIVPRSVCRLAFDEGPMPPPWPVTISEKLHKAFGVPDLPDEPQAEIDGQDYSSTANSIREKLKELELPAPNEEARSLAERTFKELTEVSRMPGIAWELEVIASGAPVAFSVPDGAIFLSDGLVSKLTEDELSAVLAHEMGHVWYQHGRALVKSAHAMGFIFLIDQVYSIATFGHPGATGAAPEILLSGGYMDVITNSALGYSRKHEIEANYAASEILCSVGIEPGALFDALRELGPVEQKKRKMGIYQMSMSFEDVHRLGQTTIDLGIMLDAGLIKCP